MTEGECEFGVGEKRGRVFGMEELNGLIEEVKERDLIEAMKCRDKGKGKWVEEKASVFGEFWVFFHGGDWSFRWSFGVGVEAAVEEMRG